MFPGLKIHEDVLIVQDGKFITSAGGTKSFEAALYLEPVSKVGYLGKREKKNTNIPTFKGV